MAKAKGRRVAVIQEDQTATTMYDMMSLDVFSRAVDRETLPGGQMDDVPRDLAAMYVCALTDILNGNMSIISPQATIRRAFSTCSGASGVRVGVDDDGR